jgi:hypothetical protein
MRGSRWIIEMEMVLMLGIMLMFMERPPPMPRRSGDDYGFDFPLTGGFGAAGLLSPGVGEDFRLLRHLCKSWKKCGVGFSSETEASVKRERVGDARVANEPR